MKLKPVELLGILFGLVLTLLINYHQFFLNFNLAPGTKGDSRLVIFILEHWLNVFRGQEAFFRLNMFYPDGLALGYADGLFLFAFPYMLFRAVGLDYFTSYQLLLVFMTTAGFAAWMLVLRKALKLSLYFSVLGSVLLTCLNSMQVQLPIGKLVGFYLCPLLIYLLYGYLSTPDKNTWRAWAGILTFSLILGLFFFTSYYPAWFFLFTLLLFGFLYFLASLPRDGFRISFGKITGVIRVNLLQISTALLAFLASLTPFLITYTPLVLLNSKRNFGLVLDFSPTVKDIVNVSGSNYLWSPIMNRIHFNYGNVETQMGSPPFILVIFVLFYLYVLFFNIRKGRIRTNSRDFFIFILASSALIIFGLIVKFHGTSLWYGIYQLVPGASALRALGRYLMVVDMIVVVSAIYALNEGYEYYKSIADRKTGYALTGVMLLVSCILILEQANCSEFDLNKSEQLTFLSRYAKPTMACNAFYIYDDSISGQPAGNDQLDAMMISMKSGIPTVNGYSGFTPDPAFSLTPSGVEYKFKISDGYLQRAQPTISVSLMFRRKYSPG